MLKFRVTSLALVFMLILSMFSVTYGVVNDYENHWASQTINKWLENGYVNGYGDGSFKPDSPLSRAEFITIINKIMAFTEKTEISFSDVTEDNWFYEQVQIAVKAGYIKGYSEFTFAPQEKITREQVAVIISRIYNLNTSETNIDFIKDSENISDWAKPDVATVINLGYMMGYDGYFNPSNPITRAEAVVTVDRVIENQSEVKPTEQTGTTGDNSSTGGVGGNSGGTTGGDSDTVKVTSLALNVNEKTLKIDEELQLTVTINPSNASNKKVSWESSNTTVAAISSTGLVTAKSCGTATITVMSDDGNKASTCKITVVDEDKLLMEQSYPYDKCTGVYLKWGYITLQFSNDMAEEQDIEGVVLSDSKGNTIDIDSIKPGKDYKNNLLIIPKDELKLNTNYSLIVPGGKLVDIDGDTYKDDFKISFTTAKNVISGYITTQISYQGQNVVLKSEGSIKASTTVVNDNQFYFTDILEGEYDIEVVSDNQETSVNGVVNVKNNTINYVKLSDLDLTIESVFPDYNQNDAYLQYGYLDLVFNEDMAQEQDKSGIILKDDEDNITDIKSVYPGVNYKNNLLIIPEKVLKFNTKYTIFIPAGKLKSANGEIYNKDINYSFTTVKNIVKGSLMSSECENMKVKLLQDNTVKYTADIVNINQFYIKNVNEGLYDIIIQNKNEVLVKDIIYVDRSGLNEFVYEIPYSGVDNYGILDQVTDVTTHSGIVIKEASIKIMDNNGEKTKYPTIKGETVLEYEGNRMPLLIDKDSYYGLNDYILMNKNNKMIVEYKVVDKIFLKYIRIVGVIDLDNYTDVKKGDIKLSDEYIIYKYNSTTDDYDIVDSLEELDDVVSIVYSLKSSHETYDLIVIK